MKINIWIIADGKKGHEKQSEELVYSLKKKLKINLVKINARSFFQEFFNFIFYRKTSYKTDLRPNLIIGAGHKTHLAILLNKIKYGGKAIVIMKPSIPLFLYDLAIIPSHDKVFPSKKKFITDGPITSIVNRHMQKEHKGLILLGGPSKNFYWDDDKILSNIKLISSSLPNKDLTIGSSRRTPISLIEKLKKLKHRNLKFIDHNDVSDKWIKKEIDTSRYSWVTQDSISMLYELIASGSIVTCIELKEKNNKFKDLFEELYLNKVINLSTKKAHRLKTNLKRISEADRCSDYIIKNFIF